MDSSIGILIPTFQAAKHLPHCLPPLLNSPLKPKILIIDSSSSDGTARLAHSMGAETLVIPQSEFNHGTTREKGRQILQTSIVVMMTQDAYAASSAMLEYLVKPLLCREASIAYARQIPHQGADFFAAFARRFNYPEQSHVRSLGDTAIYGIYTFFCSNSCAAYLNTALDEVGGFSPTMFGEDTIAVAKLLRRNHRIAYIAEAEVHHSHNYSLKQEFVRHFDIGFSRYANHNLLAIAGKDSQRGKAYIRALLQELIQKQPSLIPYALLQALVKFWGYQLGKAIMRTKMWFIPPSS